MKNNILKKMMHLLCAVFTFFNCFSCGNYAKSTSKNSKKDTILNVFNIHTLEGVQKKFTPKDLERNFFIPLCKISDDKLKLAILCKGKVGIKLTFEKKDDYYVFERATANYEEQRFSYYFLTKSKIVTYEYCCKPIQLGYLDTTHIFITIQYPNKSYHFTVDYDEHTKKKLLIPNPYEEWSDNKTTIRIWGQKELYIKDSIAYISHSIREFYTKKIRNYDTFFDDFLGSMYSCDCIDTGLANNSISREEYYRNKPK